MKDLTAAQRKFLDAFTKSELASDYYEPPAPKLGALRVDDLRDRPEFDPPVDIEIARQAFQAKSLIRLDDESSG